MPIKRVAHRLKMTKKGMKKQTLGWISSSFDATDLKKAKKDGVFVRIRGDHRPQG
jgi:hypothetical protein